MTHSLYTKFVLGYLLFGLLGFVLIATFSSHMTHEYLVRERSDAMYDEANLLASTYSDIYQGKTISLDTANPQLEAVSTYLGASAWVLDHKGAVVAETSPASHSGKTIEGFDPTVTGNKSYIIGDFFGMFPGETLSVLAPITGNFNTYGYVVLHMPMERILDSQNQILNIVYITAAIIFFLSLIILLVFTRTVYFPLKKITAGAMEYAGGNLDHTIKVKTNDEMGYLADTLNYMSSELGKMEEYQKSFIANVSHDFRSPLTSIKGYLEAILDGTIPPENERQYLQIISDESRRLSRLVRRMLDVSQLQAIDPLRNGNHFDVCESMRRVLISMEKKINDRHLDVEADIPDEPILVLGDNDMITQVIYNLLENATKFAREGSTLYLGVTTIDGKARVTVRNEGDTIPAEELPLLFERFHKSDKSRSEDKDGYGLGLYIVKTILTQHKEKITVTSENGVTAFTFTMQMAR